MEKTGEQLTYLQGGTNVTRMDYASPLFTELCVLARRREAARHRRARAGHVDPHAHDRAEPHGSHLLFMATNGMDLGAVSMMIYGWREREEVLRFFEKVTGLRMNHNYIRPGGVAADLPRAGDDICALLELTEPVSRSMTTLMTGQPIWRDRLQGVGIMTRDECLALGVTGPILRSAGIAVGPAPRRCRTLAYDQVEFDVPVRHYGDCFDRYAIRLDEIVSRSGSSARCIDKMPRGDYRTQDKKVTPPPRARIDESMEALIHHFKIFTEGFKVPEGETYAAVESRAVSSVCTSCPMAVRSRTACTCGRRAS